MTEKPGGQRQAKRNTGQEKTDGKVIWIGKRD